MKYIFILFLLRVWSTRSTPWSKPRVFVAPCSGYWTLTTSRAPSVARGSTPWWASSRIISMGVLLRLPSPQLRHHRPHRTRPWPHLPHPQQLSLPLPHLLKVHHHPPRVTRTRQLKGLLHRPQLRDPHHPLPRGPQLGSARQLEHGRATPEWITGA